MKRLALSFVILFLLIFNSLWGQLPQPPLQIKNNPRFTPAAERLAGYQQRLNLQKNSLAGQVAFRSVGPTIMSGRAVDIDANPADPGHFYVAYASGGLWKSENNGITFQPFFDDQPVMTIGDIAVDWEHGEIIWVGTGENNSSRSSYSGTGIYKSTDKGRTWTHLGLDESHHIGRIIIHPHNPDVVWVAVLGHLYSTNAERGVYKTIDGGKTWRQTLYIDDNSGAIDLIIDPTNPQILYAAMWERTRRAWNFVESGKGSGIYKSTDGGETWKLLSTPASRFPKGETVGRIGLAVYPPDPQIVYAFLDNQAEREKEEKKEALTKDMLRQMTGEQFLALKAEDIDDYLDRYGFPVKYHADTIVTLVRNQTIKPSALVDFVEDANALLFDTPVIGGEVYRSNDGGQTWQRTHEGYLDNFVYTYGYYFGEIRIDPVNENIIYILGVPILKSEDGGKTFRSIDQDNVHVDHHALWINPGKPPHLILGNDGGINISYDGGETWIKANHPPVSQFYTVAIDMAEPYQVYGGMQDNGVWAGPSTYRGGFAWHANGKYPYDWLLGGDGMQIAIDTRNNDIVYSGFQFGNYFRIERSTGKRKSIKPQHQLGERPYRFNWQTPIHLSIHNQDILYYGSQMLHRSLDQGDSWQAISGDLTKGGLPGDVPFGTLTSIHESTLKFGLIYAGSDDGLIHVTRDGGNSWQRISDKLPPNFWISRVQASAHREGTVYASLNGYRWDNFEAHLYRSTDYGKIWQRLGLDLPPEPINVVKEDPVNPQILYVGSDHGLYVSLDGGKTFMGMYKGLPHAPVHDLVIHSRERDLVVGTHGRSLYIANVEHLQQLNQEMLAKDGHLFPLKDITYNERWGMRGSNWEYRASDSLQIAFHSKGGGKVTMQILGEEDFELHAFEVFRLRGLNYFHYDLSLDAAVLESYLAKQDSTFNAHETPVKPADNGKVYLRPGKYTLLLSTNGLSLKEAFEIKKRKGPNRRQGKKTP